MTPRPRPWTLAILGPAILGLGCGLNGPAHSGAADEARAREALARSLDAWKAGEAPASLASKTPPIRVADEDWLSGLRLDSFAVDPADRAVGSSLRCPVALTLRDARGKAIRKKVVYQVGTDPVLTVIRQEGP